MNHPLKPINILLVEDSPSDANLTIRNFEQFKIANRLSWVETGEAAIDYLYRQGKNCDQPRPDLILLDLNLPGMDGREVLEIVKSDPSLKTIPIVVLTTSDDEQDMLRSYRLNANCYITKPVAIQQFLQVIQLVGEFWLAAVRLPTE